jgi:hypothetical protein
VKGSMTRDSSKSEEPLMSAIAEKLPKAMPAVMCYGTEDYRMKKDSSWLSTDRRIEVG